MRNVNKLVRVLGVATEAIKQDLSSYQLNFLCQVAAADPDPITYAEMAKLMNTTTATISRNAKLLGRDMKQVKGKWVDKGFGLVEASPNPYNSREYVLQLSPAGKKLMNRIDKILS